MKKTIVISSLLLIFGISRMKAADKPTKFFSINGNKGIRPCDPKGCGTFGAGRGSRTHNGIDLIVDENDEIKAPFDCKIIRYGYPYANDLSYRLIEIQGLGKNEIYKAKIMYIKEVFDVGSIVQRGQKLCCADNIAAKYGGGMINHVHLEIRKNGKLIDPTPFFY